MKQFMNQLEVSAFPAAYTLPGQSGLSYLPVVAEYPLVKNPVFYQRDHYNILLKPLCNDCCAFICFCKNL